MKRLILPLLFIIPCMKAMEHSEIQPDTLTCKQKVPRTLAKLLATQEQRILRSIQLESKDLDTIIRTDFFKEGRPDIRRVPSPLGQQQAIS